MVKTIRGLLTLDELKNLLTDYARKMENYTRVENDEVCIEFKDDKIKLVLKTPIERKCYYCDGTGRTGDTECWVCKGTGIDRYHETTTAYIKEYKNYPRYGMLKIEVQVDGRYPEFWKPEVEKIKAFIEKLAGKRCVIVPVQSSLTKPKIVSLSDIAKDLTAFMGGNNPCKKDS